MANFTFTLEKYRGTNSRHTCPNCNARREFSRYIDASGNYLASDVGKCNRESRCGYHKKPKEYFADNPNFLKLQQNATKKKKELVKLETTKKAKTSFDSIPFGYFKDSLGNYRQNGFVQFLSDLFRDDLEAVQNAIQKYYIGTWKDSLTVFWQIDGRGKIRTGKIMRYDIKTGKRQIVRSWTQGGETCKLKTDWIHGKIKKDFNLNQCFFGEHLLRKEPDKTVAVVEAEKTAIICSVCFPEMIWLAIGAKGYLQAERFQVLANRKVLLFPDTDAYSDWKEKVVKAQRNGFDIRISDLVEIHGSQIEKHEGFDLADYLIQEQNAINQCNSFVACYNNSLEKVLNGESLIQEFETILDEQKAILIKDGNLSETEAERIITNSENLRKIVISLA